MGNKLIDTINGIAELHKAGWTKEEVMNLLKEKEPEPEPKPEPDPEPSPEPEPKPETDPEPKPDEKDKEIEDLKNQIKEIQKGNTKKDISGDEPTNDDIIADIVRSFM